MRIRLLAWIVVGWVATAGAAARPDNVFFLGEKERPQRVVVTIGETLEKPGAPKPQMLGLLEGIVADISGAELGQLLATPMPKTRLVDARGNLERIGVAHVFGKSGVKRVELFSGNEGEFVAQEMEAEKAGESPRVAKLDPERFRAVMMDWPRFRGEIEPKESKDASANLPVGEQVEMEKPYSQSPFYLDQDMINERFARGKKSAVAPVTRVLKDETMYVRLPKGYDAKKAWGLIVWVSPGQEGKVPAVFDGALDELGIIGVGIKNVGNDREPADRFQLSLDAMWTAMRRYHVDPRRVYLTGMSGGGRIVSRMVVCFADYFTGAVPIVGMDAYFNIPVGNGKHLPGRYIRPEGKIWALARKRRMGAITGDQDMNEVGIREAGKQMVVDGMAVRVFDYKGFGHQMPSATQFREALMWVDETYQREREKDEEAARAALAKYVEKFGNRAPADEKQRTELGKVTEAGPWTPAAWEAVALLRSGGPQAK